MTKRLVTGTLHPTGKDVVFVAFIAPYKLPKSYGEKAGKAVLSILLQVRWCGDIGFPGGKVEKGETLEQALYREVEEETGFNLEECTKYNQMELITTHDIGTMHTHLFAVTVDSGTQKKVTVSTTTAPHYISENAGNIIMLLDNFDKGKGLQKFLKNQFASSVREEIASIVIDFNKYSTLPLSESITNTAIEGLDPVSYNEPEQ